MVPAACAPLRASRPARSSAPEGSRSLSLAASPEGALPEGSPLLGSFTGPWKELPFHALARPGEALGPRVIVTVRVPGALTRPQPASSSHVPVPSAPGSSALLPHSPIPEAPPTAPSSRAFCWAILSASKALRHQASHISPKNQNWKQPCVQATEPTKRRSTPMCGQKAGSCVACRSLLLADGLRLYK